MRRGDATRGVVLDEATTMAARVGLAGVTIGSLAAQTRLSKSGLFAHFGSKEALQIEVLEHAADRFVLQVIRPTLQAPRGEPRIRALVERWLEWDSAPGGCVFVAAVMELDDQPGPVRDRLVAMQRDWLDTIATVAAGAVSEGHLRADADPRQLAQDVYGVLLAFHVMHRLLGDPAAADRARHALEALLAAAAAAS